MAIFSAINAGKARKAQGKAQDALEQAIKDRPDVINPYDQVTDLSGMVSDISLANTLDTLRATGAGAGGATALAQAALQSKRGIANTIQQQEAQNAMARAQGEQAAQAQRIAQKQRVEQADILGKTFQFQAQESRDIAKLSRNAAMVQQYGQQRMDALGGMGANTASALGSFFAA